MDNFEPAWYEDFIFVLIIIVFFGFCAWQFWSWYSANAVNHAAMVCIGRNC